MLGLFAAIVVLIGALEAGAGPEVVTWPLLLAGLGIGALASQLGAVTVGAVPDEQSGEVGGIQRAGGRDRLGLEIGGIEPVPHRQPHGPVEQARIEVWQAVMTGQPAGERAFA